MFTVIWLIFFFNDTATTEIYTLSLHDALPISLLLRKTGRFLLAMEPSYSLAIDHLGLPHGLRSEEHTSELQSRVDLVCRLLLEKKKNNNEQRRMHQKKKHKNTTI